MLAHPGGAGIFCAGCQPCLCAPLFTCFTHAFMTSCLKNITILTAKWLLLNKHPTADNEKTASRAGTILSEYKEAYPELHKVCAGGFTWSFKCFL